MHGKIDLVVHTLCRSGQMGQIAVGGRVFPCALGRGGLTHFKREGDGKTPVGTWRIEQLFWRGDRSMRPGGFGRFFPARALRINDGWCDAADDANYNRFVRHPYAGSAERMWRADHLYDLVVVLAHNRRPRARGLGSAIFLHVADEGPLGSLQPTAGCVALRQRDLVIVMGMIRPGAAVVILG